MGNILAAVDIKNVAQNTINETVGEGGTADETAVLDSIITFLIWAAVAASVVMIIVGGIRYVISAGNQEKVTGAKNTIMYAIIGLIITLLAAVIVNFVFTQTDTISTQDNTTNNTTNNTTTPGN